ncbi:hypothetical protein ACU8KO_002514 [Vibrio alginolyticus]
MTETVTRLLEAACNSGVFNWDAKPILGESLAYTFDAAITCYRDGAKMELGVEGLPETTRKLVGLGLLFIDGEMVRPHPALKAKADEMQQSRASLLAKLKKMASVQPILRSN